MAQDTNLREPCGGWGDMNFLIGCYQHNISASVKKFRNVTHVNNYTSSGDTTIPPYVSLATGVVSCADEPDCGAELPICNGIPSTELVLCDSGDIAVSQSRFFNCFEETTESVDISTCRKIGFKNVQSVKVHHGKWGFLSRQGMGVGASIDTIASIFYSGSYLTGDEVSFGGLATEGCADLESLWDLQQDSTERYLTMAGSADTTDIYGNQGANSVTSTVDRYSGICTQTDGTPTGADVTMQEVSWEHIKEQLAIVNVNQSNASSFMTVLNYYKNRAYYNPPNYRFTYSGDYQNLTVLIEHIAMTASYSNWPGTQTHTLCEMTVDLVNGSFTSTQYLWFDYDGGDPMDSSGWAQFVYVQTDVSATNTTVNWQSDITYSPGYTNYNSATVTLSNPYTQAQLIADSNEMLETWDLTDDAQYNWRTDGFVTVAPELAYHGWITSREPTVSDKQLVCYTATCEGFGGVEGVDYDYLQWREADYYNYGDSDLGSHTPGDAREDVYTGDLLGEPMPAGYEHFFDFTHENWERCYDIWTLTWLWYLSGYGAYSGTNFSGDVTDGYIPNTATRWTNNFLAGYLRPGAWQDYTGGVFRCQKWAETIVARPSFKYARPCGEDRWMPDETTVRCVIPEASSSIVNLEPTGGSGSIQTGELAVLRGTSVDGVYQVTRNSDYQYSLDTASLPTRPVSSSHYEDDGTGRIAKLRYNSAPAICGRIYVRTMTDSPVTLSLKQPSYLVTGDTITLTDALGVNGYHTVTVESPSTIYVNGAGVGQYSTKLGAYISSLGSVSYIWDDVTPKHDFTLNEWSFNNYDYAEQIRINTIADTCPEVVTSSAPPRYQQVSRSLAQNIEEVVCEQACLPWNSCSPSIVCISPNTESFTNGISYDFTNTVLIDNRYGSLWQKIPIQHDIDYLYQTPICPCGYDDVLLTYECICQFDQDSEGTCPDDIEDPCQKYYPYPPVVESRCSPPNGAPAIPDDARQPGCLTTEELTTNPNKVGSICNPPGLVGHEDTGVPTSYLTEHNLYLNQVDCDCNLGQFFEDYEDSGAICDNSGFEVPAP